MNPQVKFAVCDIKKHVQIFSELAPGWLFTRLKLLITTDTTGLTRGVYTSEYLDIVLWRSECRVEESADADSPFLNASSGDLILVEPLLEGVQ